MKYDWRKSTHSGGEGNCVEVARNAPGVVAVRDSKNSGDGVLTFTAASWKVFLDQIRRP